MLSVWMWLGRSPAGHCIAYVGDVQHCAAHNLHNHYQWPLGWGGGKYVNKDSNDSLYFLISSVAPPCGGRSEIRGS